MPAHATVAEVLNYLDEVSNSDVTDRIILRASELVDERTLGNADAADAEHIEAVKNAVCAQVEYWLHMDESVDVVGSTAKPSLGSFSMGGTVATLAPRAKRYLFNAGLLYTGVRVVGRIYEDS